VTAADQTDVDSTPNNHVAEEDDQDSATCACQAPGIDLELRKSCSTEVVPHVCPHTPGYWKNHPCNWPVDHLMIGGVDYDKQELMSFLNTCTPDGEHAAWDMSVKLAKFLVAAKLSLLAGAAPGDIEDVVAEADALLADWPPGSCPSEEIADEAERLKDLLDHYLNNCPACGGDGGLLCEITWTITLTNRGPGDATGVVVTDILPAGVTFKSASADQGAYDAGTGEWTVGDVAKDATVKLVILSEAVGCGDYVNTAEVTAADQDDADSTPNNHDPAEDDQASCTASCPSVHGGYGGCRWNWSWDWGGCGGWDWSWHRGGCDD